MLDIHVVRLDPELPLPRYATAGDAGIDLHARHDAVLAPAGGRVLLPTGLAIAVPVGYGAFVLPRSGLALKFGIGVVNAPGLIDSGYRDEVKVVLINTDPTDEYTVRRGDRIAQLVIQRVEEIRWVEIDSFEGEHRGGGFGHSGR